MKTLKLDPRYTPASYWMVEFIRSGLPLVNTLTLEATAEAIALFERDEVLYN